VSCSIVRACSIGQGQYGQFYPHLNDFVEIRPLTLQSLAESRPKRTARFDTKRPAFFLHSISICVMGESNGTYVGEKHTGFWYGNLRKRKPLGRPISRWKDTLKLTSDK
jgi:hypothetical protein